MNLRIVSLYGLRLAVISFAISFTQPAWRFVVQYLSCLVSAMSRCAAVLLENNCSTPANQ